VVLGLTGVGGGEERSRLLKCATFHIFIDLLIGLASGPLGAEFSYPSHWLVEQTAGVLSLGGAHSRTRFRFRPPDHHHLSTPFKSCQYRMLTCGELVLYW